MFNLQVCPVIPRYLLIQTFQYSVRFYGGLYLYIFLYILS